MEMSNKGFYNSIYRHVFHVVLFLLLFCMPFFVVLVPDDRLEFVLMRGSGFVPVYFLNVYFFIPRFLKTGRYGWYAFFILASCLFGIVVTNIVSDAYLGGFGKHLLRPMPNIRGTMLTLLLLAIGTSFEMVFNWEIQRRERTQIEKEKVLLELSFLKSQVNPHFLFNALNNIHSLAELRSDKTSDAVLMLSDLLRYMLYDSGNGRIPLQKEIECLENYIAIQRLRISAKEPVTIRFDTQGTSGNTTIEPLLLLPFVENAFKHGVSYNQRSEVNIRLNVENSILQFHVHNTKKSASGTEQTESSGGVGLNNTKRRLDILYPKRHELIITEDDSSFDSRLTIIL
jgi:sensor histidine kinase YesM